MVSQGLLVSRYEKPSARAPAPHWSVSMLHGLDAPSQSTESARVEAEGAWVDKVPSLVDKAPDPDRPGPK